MFRKVDMKNRIVNRIIFAWILAVAIMAIFGKVAVAASNGGRTAADFLQIGLGARAAAMGGAYSAASADAGAAYWNPAGLTSVNAGEVVFGHFSWYQDIKMEYGALAFKTSDRTSVAVSITYLGYGQIDGYDISGNSTGEQIAAYDWAGGLSFAYRFNQNLSLGVTGKFVNQRLDDINGSAYALDIGARYEFERFTVAGVLANFGTRMDFDGVTEQLPTSTRLAITAHPWGPSFGTSLELDNRFQGGAIIRQGVEYSYDGQYFIRTGYQYLPQADQRSFGQGMSFGVGALVSGALRSTMLLRRARNTLLKTCTGFHSSYSGANSAG